MTKSKRKVLVIGGGTGATTADMLEHMPQFDVTLAEASNQLGGHINTLNFGKLGIAEGGAEFIGPQAAYPNTHAHFKALGVKLDEFAMSTHIDPIDKSVSDNEIVLPPIYKATQKVTDSGCFGFFKKTANNNERQGKIKVDWASLISDFPLFIELQIALCKLSARIDNNPLSPRLTLEDFIEHFKEESVLSNDEIDKLAKEVIYPLVAASWGVPIADAKSFLAHYALNYISLGMTWFDAPQGLSSYIDAMQARWQHCHVKTNTAIVALEPVEEKGELRYKAKLASGQYLMTDDSQCALFDDVIITTSAEVTAKILPQTDELKALQQLLEQVRYYNTEVVFHRDPRFETGKDTVIHTRLEGGTAANTAQKDWKGPVMKTWLLPGQQPIDETKILARKKYRHPIMDHAYHQAQTKLRELQHKSNLHFGGILAGLGDSHEDGLTVALQNAHYLCEKAHCLTQNNRLMPLLNEQQQVIEKNQQLSAELLEAQRDAMRPSLTWCCY